MLITVSGLPGSGTSTVARALASELGLEHVDGGTVFRALASEQGVSLAEFARIAEADDAIDRALDDRLLARARAGQVVLESRLAGWLAHRAGLDGLKVWISCDEVERAARVGGRDGHQQAEALATNQEREESERTRYLAYYDIDLTDLGPYDEVIDSTEQSPEVIVAALVRRAQTGT